MTKVIPPYYTGRAAAGLLILRLMAGIALMFHGWPLIQKPFDWMPPQPHVPGILQLLAALSEFGGGAALVLGLFTPLAAFGILCTMATAIGMVHLPKGDPFVSPTPGGRSWELAAVYLTTSLVMLLAGPGSISLDALLFGRVRDRAAEETPLTSGGVEQERAA